MLFPQNKKRSTTNVSFRLCTKLYKSSLMYGEIKKNRERKKMNTTQNIKFSVVKFKIQHKRKLKLKLQHFKEA